MTYRFTLLHLAEARDAIRAAALVATDHEPRTPDLWHDRLTGQHLSTHRALDGATKRIRAEHPHLAKLLHAADEALARGAGWSCTAHQGGLAWREPGERGGLHTLEEVAAIVCGRLVRPTGDDDSAPMHALRVDRDPAFDQTVGADNDDSSTAPDLSSHGPNIAPARAARTVTR